MCWSSVTCRAFAGHEAGAFQTEKGNLVFPDGKWEIEFYTLRRGFLYPYKKKKILSI